MDIQITPPKFDLNGFYEARIKQMVHANNLTSKIKVETLKALVNQAYQQGRYDARIVTKDPTRWQKEQ